MINTSIPSIPDTSSYVLCCYANYSHRLQIIRITNIPNFRFEQIVFPDQNFLFEALPEGIVEVYMGSPVGEVLLERIPCDRLGVGEAGGQNGHDSFH